MDQDGQLTTASFQKNSNLTISSNHQTLCSDTPNIAKESDKYHNGAMYTILCLSRLPIMNLMSYHQQKYKLPNISICLATSELLITFTLMILTVLIKLLINQQLVLNQVLTIKMLQHPCILKTQVNLDNFNEKNIKKNHI